MLMKKWLSFVSTKTNKQNEGICIGKSNVIHFQKQLVPTRSVEPEKNYFAKYFGCLQLEPEPEILVSVPQS